MADRGEITKLLVRTIIFFVLAAAAYSLLILFAGRWLKEVSTRIAGSGGYAEIFLYVYAVDTLIVPATVDIVFTVSQRMNPVILIAVVSSASIAGGFSGYMIGRYLNHLSIVKKITDHYRERGEHLISKYGAWAVAIAAFTPVPYSTVSYLAGMFRIPPLYYLAASLARIPRLTLYYLAIREGIHFFS